MKIGKFTILSIGIAGFFMLSNKDKIKELASTIVEKGKSFIVDNLRFKLNGKPSIKLEIKKGSIRLAGSLLVENSSSFSARLDSYKLNLTLVLPNKTKLLLASTPIQTPKIEITSNKRTKVNYQFYLPLSQLAKLLETKKADLKQSSMHLDITDFVVNDVSVTPVSIDLTTQLHSIINIAENPSSLITNWLDN